MSQQRQNLISRDSMRSIWRKKRNQNEYNLLLRTKADWNRVGRGAFNHYDYHFRDGNRLRVLFVSPNGYQSGRTFKRSMKWNGPLHKHLMRRGLFDPAEAGWELRGGRLFEQQPFRHNQDYIKFENDFDPEVHSYYQKGDGEIVYDPQGLNHLNSNVKDWFRLNNNFFDNNTEIHMFFGFNMHRIFTQEDVRASKQQGGGSIWSRRLSDWLMIGYEDPTYFKEYADTKLVAVKNAELQAQPLVQKFLDGEVSHCVLQPIKDHYIERRESVTSKGTKANYNSFVNNCDRLMELYKEGIPTDGDHLQQVADKLKVNLRFVLPTVKQPFINVKCTTKRTGVKNFTYLNTRFNHVDIFTHNQAEEVVIRTQEEMHEILDKIHATGRVIPLKDYEDKILYIKDIDKTYKFKSGYDDAVEQFEEANKEILNTRFKVGDPCGDFIRHACHFPGAVDFNNPFLMDPEFCCDTEADMKDIRAIDGKKMYFNYKMCPLYDGFLHRCSDFRWCSIPVEDACETAGFYQINNVDLSTSPYSQHLRQFNFVHNDQIFPHPMIKFLHQCNVTFEIVAGAYGSKGDIEMGEEMKGEMDGVKHYAKWTGRQYKVNETTNFQFRKDDEEFLTSLKYYLEEQGIEDTTLTTNNYSKWATLRYKKEVAYHRSHISAYITCYSMITTILQSFEIDCDAIVRVRVDGIYFMNQDDKYNKLKMIGSFRPETNKNGVNACVCDAAANERKSYINIKPYREFDAPIVDYVKWRPVTLKKGAGGNGKTYSVLMDVGYRQVVYNAHSNKLCRGVAEKYGDKVVHVAPFDHILHGDYTELALAIRRKASVMLFDEVSTYTHRVIRTCIEFCAKYGIKAIFAGDIGYQVDPFCGDGIPCRPAAERLKLFPYQQEEKKNYRFTDKTHHDCCFAVRDMMDAGKKPHELLQYLREAGYKFVNKEEMYGNIMLEDMLLCSEHKIIAAHNKLLSEMFTDFKKYRVKKTNTRHCAGEVLISDEKLKYFETYGFTIHSVQGEDYESYIYIDINRLKNNKILYTAISRAHGQKQVVFVGTEIPVYKAMRPKRNPYKQGKIYKIKSPHTDKVYIGSTVLPLQQRFQQHVDRWKLYKDGRTTKYTTSYDILDCGDAFIELLCDYDCSTDQELKMFEGIQIKAEANAVNQLVPGRTEEQAAIDLKEKRKANMKKKVECEHCGAMVSRKHLYRHKKTKVCIAAQQQVEQPVEESKE